MGCKLGPNIVTKTGGRPLDGSDTESASFYSDSISIGAHTMYSVQVVISEASSLNSTVELQGSIDGTVWVDVQDTKDTTVTDDGTVLFDVVEAAYPLVRLKYVRTAGSCKIAAKVFAKGS